MILENAEPLHLNWNISHGALKWSRADTLHLKDIKKWISGRHGGTTRAPIQLGGTTFYHRTRLDDQDMTKLRREPKSKTLLYMIVLKNTKISPLCLCSAVGRKTTLCSVLYV